jgi:hypothetical protein
MFRKAILVFVLLSVAGCKGSKDRAASPEETLRDYIARSFVIKSEADKSKLLELSTGEVKQALDSLSSDDFKKYFIDSKRELKSLKVRDDRVLGDGRRVVTYEMEYVDTAKDAKNAILVKKQAIFEHAAERWLISSVQTGKTLVTGDPVVLQARSLVEIDQDRKQHQSDK